MKKLLMYTLASLSALGLSPFPSQAATLVSFGNALNPAELSIPKGTLNPFKGGRGWGFKRGQTFSLSTQWSNFNSHHERVELTFNLEEDDVLFDDIISITAAPFILPAQSAVTKTINFTLSKGQLNSLCEPSCDTRFGLGYFAENKKLEFRVASPTYTAVAIPNPVPEPLTILGSATALGFGALFKLQSSKKQKDKSKL